MSSCISLIDQLACLNLACDTDNFNPHNKYDYGVLIIPAYLLASQMKSWSLDVISLVGDWVVEYAQIKFDWKWWEMIEKWEFMI